jgi:hypothetical protein
MDSRALRMSFPDQHDDWMAVKWLLWSGCPHLTGPLPREWPGHADTPT